MASGEADLHDVELRRILPQKSLHEIVEKLPATKAELKSIKGMGEHECSNFGKEILEMVIAFRQEKGLELPVNASKGSRAGRSRLKTTSYELFISGRSIAEIAAIDEWQFQQLRASYPFCQYRSTGTGQISEPQKVKRFLNILKIIRISHSATYLTHGQ